MEQAALAPAAPLLRPDQIDEMVGEREALEAKMRNPAVQDKGAVAETLRRLTRQLEAQTPKPFAANEIDAAVRRAADLRAKISEGMLSHEEMRKCPPGAVDQHRRWERANKGRIAEYQNLQRRLHAGSDDREVASIENFRPQTSNLSMAGALIPGKQFFLPPGGAELPVAFTDDDLQRLRALAPDLADKLGTLDNAQRREVKDALGDRAADPAPAKRTMTPEHKAKMIKAAADARAAKKAKG